MFRSRSHTSTTLEEAVEVLLGLMNPAAMDVLVEMQEDELAEHQVAFAEKLCDHLKLEEEELLTLCLAKDIETAAAKLIRATWSEARVRRLH